MALQSRRGSRCTDAAVPGCGAPRKPELARIYVCLVAYFRRRLPSSQQTDAEEMAQDSLVAAWLGLTRDDGAGLEPVRYSLGIARNKLNAALREKYARREVALELVCPEGVSALVCNPRAEEALEATERYHRLAVAFTWLRPIERCIIVLRFFEGCGNREASRRLCIPPDEGSRLKYEALEKLRARLESPEARRRRRHAGPMGARRIQQRRALPVSACG